MSETQNEYETEHETDTEPTPGPWKQADGSADHLHVGENAVVKELKSGGCAIIAKCNRVFGDSNYPECEGDSRVNAALIAAAGTAAQEAKEMGYDPQKAVEATKKMLMALENIRHGAKPNSHLERLAERALASAEGSGDE